MGVGGGNRKGKGVFQKEAEAKEAWDSGTCIH